MYKRQTYGETAGINANTDRFRENVTAYDKNGNIKTLQRYGQTGASTYGLIDNLTFTLGGLFSLLIKYFFWVVRL